VPMTELLFFTK
jgi:hypothetical protein